MTAMSELNSNAHVAVTVAFALTNSCFKAAFLSTVNMNTEQRSTEIGPLAHNVCPCTWWTLPSPEVLTSPPLKGSRGNAASRRQLILKIHTSLATLSSRCYYWESGTGAWELLPPVSRTLSSHLPSGSWTTQHNLNLTSAPTQYRLCIRLHNAHWFALILFGYLV